MEEYIKVDVNQYVNAGLENATLVPIQAEKYMRIIARQGIVSENVVSWSSDEFGNEVKEKVASVEVDDITGLPGWVVTKADENGDVVVDNNGHTNEWIIADSTFVKKYEEDMANPGLFKPKGGPQVFVQISDNIILNQWGSDMKIASGGYINITNPDYMYGISQRDFVDTYKISSDMSVDETKIRHTI